MGKRPLCSLICLSQSLRHSCGVETADARSSLADRKVGSRIGIEGDWRDAVSATVAPGALYILQWLCTRIQQSRVAALPGEKASEMSTQCLQVLQVLVRYRSWDASLSVPVVLS